MTQDVIFASSEDWTPPSGGGNSGSSNVGFPLPWLDYASTAIPNSLTLVLRWAEYLWMSQGTYRQACQRTVRYFITDLQITDIEDDKAEDVKDILEHFVKIRSFLCEAGDAFICYGNVFLVRHIPFKRYLSCRCGCLVPFDEAEEQGLYKWEGYQFLKSEKGCPTCKAKGNTEHEKDPWHIHDSQSKDPKDVRLLLLNPHELEIAYHPYTKAKKFFWNIPTYITGGIQNGVPIMLRETPEEIIEACKTTKRLELDSSAIFHAAEPAPCGFYTGGWGLPRVISNFRLAFHYQVLNRFDQAIAMDYINGMRVISPEVGTSNGNGAGDPLLALGGSAFRSAVTSMVTTHRKDPATWQVSGFPLKYQLFGGEGQALSPKDLMKLKLDEWLDATGVPAELYHGTLTVQAAPMALRIFENAWPEITALYNNILEWITSYLVEVMEAPKFRVELLKPRLVDDLERRGLLLQLMGGNQISPQTALQTLGITNPRDEVRRSFEWQQIAAEEEAKFQEHMDQLAESQQIKQQWQQKSQTALGGPGGAPMDPGMAGGAGGAPGGPGGAPAPGAGATDSPEAMAGEADRIAQQLLQGDPASRRRTLLDLKKTNSSLWAVVKGKLQDYEQQAKSTGVQMLRSGQMPPGQPQA